MCLSSVVYPIPILPSLSYSLHLSSRLRLTWVAPVWVPQLLERDRSLMLRPGCSSSSSEEGALGPVHTCHRPKPGQVLLWRLMRCGTVSGQGQKSHSTIPLRSFHSPTLLFLVVFSLLCPRGRGERNPIFRASSFTHPCAHSSVCPSTFKA